MVTVNSYQQGSDALFDPVGCVCFHVVVICEIERLNGAVGQPRAARDQTQFNGHAKYP